MDFVWIALNDFNSVIQMMLCFPVCFAGWSRRRRRHIFFEEVARIVCVRDGSAISTSSLVCRCNGVYKGNQNLESEVSRSDLICVWIVFFLACMCLVFEERLSMAKVCCFSSLLIYIYSENTRVNACTHGYWSVWLRSLRAAREWSKAGRVKRVGWLYALSFTYAPIYIVVYSYSDYFNCLASH